EFVGNYYATRFIDAWDAVSYACDKLKSLEQRTVQFVAELCESDMPAEVLEAALFNLSTLRTQTCFMSAEGKFYGWEGCCDHSGCCWGTSIHVWNYEQSTAFLFGPIAKDL
ncbi:hypothetical protein RZS08_49320, partial [Arthrospira platensis SPKY1]|nr:hypothetical protein [Arthrospira platensis SPKY1]